MLKEQSWKINILNQKCYHINYGLMAGYTFDSGNIYLFSYPGSRNHTSYIIDHEIGHLVRFQLISDEDFKEYLKMRNFKDSDYYFDKQEELFAENFYWLFGSNQKVKYRPTYPKPTQKEKDWIINKLKKQEI